MKHWELLGTAPIPGTGDSMHLYKGKDDFSIKLKGGYELMNTRKHGSEDALGRLPCRRLQDARNAHVLVGGLGMGFTLAAVLAEVGADAMVTVAELVPEVVEWNHGPLGEASGYPLNDPRVRLHPGDVGRLIRASNGIFDVITLDVDNGPAGLTARANDWLYSMDGINAAQHALRPGGVLAYWSAAPDRIFQERLRRCGFDVDEVRVHAHGSKGTRHVIWLLSLD